MNEFQLLVLRNGERRGRAPKLRLEILERSEHQGERRAELVAHVGKECCLGAVDLSQGHSAFALNS